MFFKNPPNIFIIFCILIILLIKFVFYYLVKVDIIEITLGGGDDADYYNDYALNYESYAVNIWPIILNLLNEMGFYSRDVISYVLLFLNLFIIPFLIAKISGLSFKKYNQKIFLYCTFFCLVYPTIYFYTFDVYRDVFMIFCFLIGCFFVKRMIFSKKIKFIINLLLCLLIGIFLIELRPYLGYAFLLSLFLWKIKINRKNFIFWIVFYFFSLIIANYMGFFNRLVEYRSGFQENSGGSTLGLDFSNPIMFIPNFILSIMGQLFGLYITNPFAIILFLAESLPFGLMLIYVIKNLNKLDDFLNFLLIFFVIYASIWLIGNDNLGTAVRLRIYNYISIIICFFYILNIKNIKLNGVFNK